MRESDRRGRGRWEEGEKEFQNVSVEVREVKREEPYSFRINLARCIETDLHAGSVCWRICYKKVKKGREKEGEKRRVYLDARTEREQEMGLHTSFGEEV